MNNLVAFIAFSLLCNHDLCPVPKHFCKFKINPFMLEAASFYSPCTQWFVARTNLSHYFIFSGFFLLLDKQNMWGCIESMSHAMAWYSKAYAYECYDLFICLSVHLLPGTFDLFSSFLLKWMVLLWVCAHAPTHVVECVCVFECLFLHLWLSS